MRLLGKIDNAMVVILVDSGSTQNFLYPSTMTKNNLPIDEAGQLKVRVANGKALLSKGSYQNVTPTIQGTHF